MQPIQHHHDTSGALLAQRPSARTDEREVTAAVKRYCAGLHANASDTVAAINWALRQAGDTFSAIRAGRQRAAQLHWRRTHSTPTQKA
ncbi:hypothetical protein [Arenimonas caeni]|uniref:Uncharacterized protein n=1 Tax=Arenimonas caeni TaxID=2058085 RepID=A0A2P6M9I0_9GAMM|nr:hypothetical protein [Arenimonas caeni]PRH82608.1 hypothetical protein C6N40_06445 [Arenimonas caeni]